MTSSRECSAPSPTTTKEIDLAKGPKLEWKGAKPVEWGAFAVSIAAILFSWRASCHNENTTKVDQRACVGVSRIYNDNLQKGKPFSVFVTFKNSGKTPALEYKEVTWIEYVPAKTIPAARLDSQNAPSGILQANSEMTSKFTVEDNNANPKLIDNIAAGARDLYVSGRITYKDIFGDSHDFRYGYRYFPEFDSYRMEVGKTNGNY
jgi:hypothetical protein